jgi:hypothetical protein
MSHLVNHEHVSAGEAVEQPARRTVGERRVHLVEEVLGAHEDAAVAVLQGLEQQPRGQAGLADAGGADEDDVLGLGTNSSSAKVRIWRWLTPACRLKGKLSRVHCSGRPARLMRLASAPSWLACQ